MNTRTRSLLAIALTTALCAPVALAQSDTTSSATDQSQTTSATTSADTQAAESKSAKGTKWADLDTDGDGRISASEASTSAGFNSRFAVIDADGDGYATESEYRDYAATAGKKPSDSGQVARDNTTSWADLDTDGDGRISTMEASSNAGLNNNFSAIDSNRDGYLTDIEYRSYTASESSGSESEVPQWDALAELDADGDGRIGSDEVVGFVGTLADMDTDGDGLVTDAEYRASLSASGASGDGRGVWSVMDTDRDGRISRNEVDSFSESFTSIDADGDGFVSNSEYTSHARTASGTTAADPDRAMGGVSSGQSTSAQGGKMEGGTAGQPVSQSSPPSPPPTQSQGAAQAVPHSAVVQRDIWNRLDTDGDGRISSVEASLDAEFSGNFSMNDVDGDGFITAAEYRDHAQDMHRNIGGTRSQSSDTTKGTMDVDENEDDDETSADEGAVTPPDDER